MKTTVLSKDELRSILGGKTANGNSPVTTQGFPCRVVERDGTVREIIVETVEDCLEFGGMN
ncbi:MAG: hypothetical protein K2K64_00805 [Muribaculaceae bacterium]|nr:hypothetical protein [Muribaculaceae bacterium]